MGYSRTGETAVSFPRTGTPSGSHCTVVCTNDSLQIQLLLAHLNI